MISHLDDRTNRSTNTDEPWVYLIVNVSLSLELGFLGELIDFVYENFVAYLRIGNSAQLNDRVQTRNRFDVVILSIDHVDNSVRSLEKQRDVAAAAGRKCRLLGFRHSLPVVVRRAVHRGKHVQLTGQLLDLEVDERTARELTHREVRRRFEKLRLRWLHLREDHALNRCFARSTEASEQNARTDEQ